MKIKNINIPNEENHARSCSASCVDTEIILSNVILLHKSFGGISPLHSIYLDTIKDIQIDLIEQLKNNQFEDPYFVANTTANFVNEITKDLRQSARSCINKLIEEFQFENPTFQEQIVSSKLGMKMSYRFIVDQMSQLEDKLRAKAMAEADQTRFTKHDKKRIIATLTSVIYDHTRTPAFPKNKIGIALGKITEKIITSGITLIALRHIEKSISIARTLDSEEQPNERLRFLISKKGRD